MTTSFNNKSLVLLKRTRELGIFLFIQLLTRSGSGHSSVAHSTAHLWHLPHEPAWAPIPSWSSPAVHCKEPPCITSCPLHPPTPQGLKCSSLDQHLARAELKSTICGQTFAHFSTLMILKKPVCKQLLRDEEAKKTI